MKKGAADANPHETSETFVEHARGVLRRRSPGATGRTVAGLDDVRRTHRGAGTALAQQMKRLVDMLNDAFKRTFEDIATVAG